MGWVNEANISSFTKVLSNRVSIAQVGVTMRIFAGRKLDERTAKQMFYPAKLHDKNSRP